MGRKDQHSGCPLISTHMLWHIDKTLKNECIFTHVQKCMHTERDQRKKRKRKEIEGSACRSTLSQVPGHGSYRDDTLGFIFIFCKYVDYF